VGLLEGRERCFVCGDDEEVPGVSARDRYVMTRVGVIFSVKWWA
jgi:hypothetical protein